MPRTALILGDQLNAANPALRDAERVVLVEARTALARRPYHRQRRHLVLSAMRHFARELREQGHDVVEHRGARSFATALRRHGKDIVCAAPNSAHTRTALADLGVEFVTSTQFLTDPEDFARWADGRKRIVMEDFYREQRRRHGLLLTPGGEPEGGRWNYDRENRKAATEGLTGPPPWMPEEDEIDAEVRADLDRMGLPAWGEDGPRKFPATRREAQNQLRAFVHTRLPEFGPWQDTMVPGRSALFHSRLSVALNLWLLDPLEVAEAAERAYRSGDAPLASVEGFVRQVIGWREYVWGMYWWRLQRWGRENALAARRPLGPAFAEGAETGANCLDTCVSELGEEGWLNHIQRLMVLGNAFLLTGTEPGEAIEWFRYAFADGADWVMPPNGGAMATHADGGVMFTKPYPAGGNYIDRMSGYCGGCRFDPKQRTGDDACPFSALYWDFIGRHSERWARNRRMVQAVRTWERFGAEEQRAISARAKRARSELA